MRIVFGLVLILGLGLAGFAVYMAQGYIAETQLERDRLQAAQDAAPELVNVVVANKPLKYGDKLTREDLEVIKWQADKVPEGAFNIIASPQGGDPAIVPVYFEGETRLRAALRSLEAFEPVLLKKITEPGVDGRSKKSTTKSERTRTASGRPARLSGTNMLVPHEVQAEPMLHPGEALELMLLQLHSRP